MTIYTTPLLQKLAAYLRNNWRPIVTQEANVKSRVRYTAAEYVYNNRRDLVEQGVREILGMGPSDTVDFSRPECFQNRTAAIKRVLENMSVRDREDVDAQVDMHRRTGLPAEMQRR